VKKNNIRGGCDLYIIVLTVVYIYYTYIHSFVYTHYIIYKKNNSENIVTISLLGIVDLGFLT